MSNMNEIKSLEHATLKVPYEVFNKKYRNAQRVLDVEARHVSSAADNVDTAAKKGSSAKEIDALLGGMVEKLTTMKRKASEAITEEVQAAFVCKKRLEHLKEQAEALADPNAPQVKTTMNQFRKVRLDRMIVDYFLRNGYYDSATRLADARGLRDLTNVDIYAAAAEVEAELGARRTARCLQWCADNRSKLRRLNSNMEFKIRVQEFIELVREDRRLEAVRYAKKHFSTYEDGQLDDIQHCMGMLAFPKDTDVEPYRSLLGSWRWAALVRQFRYEHARLLHPAALPPLPVALQLGLAALNTPLLLGRHARVGVPGVRAAAQHARALAAARALLALAARVSPVAPPAQRAQPAHGAAEWTGVRRAGPEGNDEGARIHHLSEDEGGVLHEARREGVRHVDISSSNVNVTVELYKPLDFNTTRVIIICRQIVK